MKEGVNHIFIKVISGKLRLNHGCFTPDGGTWLSTPTGGRRAHYDLQEPNEYGKCQEEFGQIKEKTLQVNEL